MRRLGSPTLPFPNLPPQSRSDITPKLSKRRAQHSKLGDDWPLRPFQRNLFGADLRVVSGEEAKPSEKSVNQQLLKHISLLHDAPSYVYLDILGTNRRDMTDEILHLEDYVSIENRPYLDRHFSSWVGKIRPLRKLSIELEKAGKSWVGDVVQMTDAELLQTTSATEKTLTILKADLASVGLRLGMKTLNWKPSSLPYITR